MKTPPPGRYAVGGSPPPPLLGVLEVANGPAGDECPAGVPQECLQHYGTGVGGQGPALKIPYDSTGGPLRPYPAVVVSTGAKVRVVRIS